MSLPRSHEAPSANEPFPPEAPSARQSQRIGVAAGRDPNPARRFGMGLPAVRRTRDGVNVTAVPNNHAMRS
ncbi:hypothetical protein BV20DRAFT_972460 [Pilatotrama ljubarskyi]|nr:hypothetical protein BV20DRAFT_972460 [Pilatotrama ljubarskyi]